MSIEYTLDIQLTEMGFPDLVHPQEASIAETPPNSSPSNNNSFQNCTLEKSLPDQHIQPLKNKQLTEENTSQSSETGKNSSPLHPPQDKRSEAKNASEVQSKVINEAKSTTEENSSDDSDVSYMEDDMDDEDDFCEEEEEEDNGEEDGNFPCSNCNLQFSSMFKLQDHMNLHTGARPYYCAECGKRFSQIHNYRTHLRSHARAKTKQPKCRICLRRFENETDLNYHLSMNHFEDKFFECDRCKRVFTCLKACQHHIEFSCMRKVMCENCGRYFPKEKLLKRHLESRMCYSNLKCTECPQVFARKNDLLKHSFSHLGLLPYTCVRCRCHFRLARLYLRHKCKPQSIHCVACLREFLNDHDFQQHKKDTGCWGNQDSKGDEIRCLECGQRFDTKDDLKKHAGAHQRVLKCAECGKGFRSALLLMSHMGGHAGQSPCLCQSCGLGFPHQQNFDIHLKTCGQTPPPTKQTKKHKTTKRSDHKTTGSMPTPLGFSASSYNSGTEVTTPTPVTSVSDNTANVVLMTQEPKLSEASSTVSEVNVVALQQTILEKSTSDLCQTSRGPSNDSESPNFKTVAQDSSPTKPNQDDTTEGCWKLSLDKPPPPGVNLLLFLPVTQNQSSNVILPCAVPQLMSVPEIQVQASPLSNGLRDKLQVSAVSGATCKSDTDALPLDLSNKSSLKCIPNTTTVSTIKSEPKEMDISAPNYINMEKNLTNLHEINERKRPFDTSVDSCSQLSTSLHKKVKMEPESNL